MPGPVPTWPAFLAGLILACAPGTPTPPEPPRPADLSVFDPKAVERIQGALDELAKDPRSSQAWAELGFVYATERLKELGVECFRVAASLDPGEPRWPYREAILLAQRGSFEDAIAAMAQSLAIAPRYAPSHARMGDYHLAMGDLDRAEEAYQEACRLDSSYPAGWVGLARIALQRDRPEEATEILERLRRDDPDERLFVHLLDLARRQQGAEPSAAEVETLDGEDLPVWNDPWELEARAHQRVPEMLQVATMLREGHPEEALQVLEEDRRLGGNPLETALSVATAQRQLGHDDLAMREIDALLADDPENCQALVMKADLLDDGGDVRGGLALLERVTQLQPTFAGAFAAKADTLVRVGAFEAAVEAFERARELGLWDVHLRFGLGTSLVGLQRWEEARDCFEALAKEQPGDGDTWLELAITRLRSESLESAEEALARAKETGTATARLLENVEQSLARARARRERKAEGGAPR